MTVTKLDFDFLAWVERCLFPKDFYESMLALGIKHDVAWTLSHSDAILKQNGSIVALYQAYGLENDEFSQALMTYINAQQADYDARVALGLQFMGFNAPAPEAPVKPEVKITPEQEAELKQAMAQCARDQLGSGYVDTYYRNFAGPFVAIAKWWVRDILNGKV